MPSLANLSTEVFSNPNSWPPGLKAMAAATSTLLANVDPAAIRHVFVNVRGRRAGVGLKEDRGRRACWSRTTPTRPSPHNARVDAGERSNPREATLTAQGLEADRRKVVHHESVSLDRISQDISNWLNPKQKRRLNPPQRPFVRPMGKVSVVVGERISVFRVEQRRQVLPNR